MNVIKKKQEGCFLHQHEWEHALLTLIIFYQVSKGGGVCLPSMVGSIGVCLCSTKYVRYLMNPSIYNISSPNTISSPHCFLNLAKWCVSRISIACTNWKNKIV